jgi:ribosome-binding factor A
VRAASPIPASAELEDVARHKQNPRGGKAPSQRQLRVGEEIRHALSEILRRAEFRDPDLVGQSITVTEVRVSPDLRNATAFVLPLGTEAAPLVKALNRASSFLRGQLSSAIHLRYMPSMTFVYDESFDEANRIDAIIHRPEVARDLLHKPEEQVKGDIDGDRD